MEHYSIVEFNKRRLMRGEKFCYRADVLINGEPDGWVWLDKKSIEEIKKDSACSISGLEIFEETK